MSRDSAWYVAKISDGGAHYGQLVGNRVIAVCGNRFTPLRNPLNGTIAVMSRPADPAHACECRRLLSS